jgi:hypothetical protein
VRRHRQEEPNQSSHLSLRLLRPNADFNAAINMRIGALVAQGAVMAPEVLAA